MKNKKPFVREVILVEGKYDKNTLSQIVDAAIVTTDGFSVFQDREKLAFFRRLAAQRGLIVLTDSDGAGFLIRNFLKGAIPKEQLKQAYVPDVYGKERRKRRPGKEGKLGVEGMTAEVLLDALRHDHQAGFVCAGAFRQTKQRRTPEKAAAPTGSAGAFERQRHAGCVESAGGACGIGSILQGAFWSAGGWRSSAVKMEKA